MSHEKRSRRRNTKSRKASLLLASLLAVLVFSVCGTAAYLITQTTAVTNTFVPGTIVPTITEEFDGTTKKNVSIQNTGTVEAFIRAKIIVNWVDADGNVIYDASVSADDYVLDLNIGTNQWFEHDGYYYWPNAVASGASTGKLINECKLASNATVPVTGSLSVEILAQAMQTEPENAIEAAWSGIDADVTATPKIISAKATN